MGGWSSRFIPRHDPTEDWVLGFDALALNDALCLCLIFHLCGIGNYNPVFTLLQEYQHQVIKIRNRIT